MPELPTITAARLIRALRRDGFFLYHAGDLKRGTLRSILRQANITVDQLMELL